MTQPSMELGRITITRTLDDQADGGVAINVEYSDGLPLIDAVGMLAFAQATTFDNYQQSDGDTWK